MVLLQSFKHMRQNMAWHQSNNSTNAPAMSEWPHSPLPLSGNSLSAQEQPEPNPPNPLIYLDIWLFGGLILVVMVVVIARYLWRALQPDRRDPEEGLQPWEDPDYYYDRDEN